MRIERTALSCWVLIAGLSLACGKADPGAAPAPGSAAPAANAAELPPPKTVNRTTSGEIATGNLSGQIKALEAMASAPDPEGKRRRQLIDLLAARAEFAGRIDDLTRAAALAEELPKDPQADGESYLARAGMRSALHRFDEALADLDEAEKRGVPAARTRSKRASIAQGRGLLDEALALQSEARTDRPDINATGALAAILGELGRREEALGAFHDAFASYKSTSPFPVAWLFFRQGQFWEQELRKDLAIAHYQAALERVPSYAHAAAHLARLSPPDRAEAVLQPLLATSDDPDLEAVLADKLKERGDAAGAQAHVAKAASRYEELVNRHPAAFADHAAQFWLDVGGDPKKALDLARKNLAVRKTPKAYELAVLAALSAEDRVAACEIGTEGAQQPRASSTFKDIVKGACEKR